MKSALALRVRIPQVSLRCDCGTFDARTVELLNELREKIPDLIFPEEERVAAEARRSAAEHEEAEREWRRRLGVQAEQIHADQEARRRKEEEEKKKSLLKK